ALHGDPDGRLLERRRIVHTVAGHGDDHAVGLPGAYDAELVLGRDARVHGHAGHPPRQLVLGRPLELRTDHDLLARLQDAQLPRDGARGVRVVAGDHDGPDAGTRAPRHG